MIWSITFNTPSSWKTSISPPVYQTIPSFKFGVVAKLLWSTFPFISIVFPCKAALISFNLDNVTPHSMTGHGNKFFGLRIHDGTPWQFLTVPLVKQQFSNNGVVLVDDDDGGVQCPFESRGHGQQ